MDFEELKKILIELNDKKQKNGLRLSNNLKQQLQNIEIKDFNTIQEKVWSIINNTDIRPKCQSCNNHTSFINLQKGFLQYCSVKCSTSSLEIITKCKNTTLERYGDQNYRNIEKAKKTSIERYGVDNVMKNEQVKEQIYKNNLNKFGVKHTFQREDVKQLICDINLERYGHRNAAQGIEAQNKIANTCLQKYNASTPLASKEIRKKGQETLLTKIGVEYAMQDPNIFYKQQLTCNKIHFMTLPSGNVRSYQGYENIAILELLNYYTEDEIISERSNLPIIIYDENKRYFPDIFIPSTNEIIEVKSSWTIKNNKHKNKLKQQACFNLGYKFQFWICSNKEVLFKNILI